MKTVAQWFEEYGESHRHPANKRIHAVCVPLITFGLLGLLGSLPVPAGVRAASPLLNWAVLFALLAALFYLRLSRPLFVGMALGAAGLLGFVCRRLGFRY